MGMITVVFLVCSLRTNVVFFIIFLTLVPTFSLITASYWFLAMDFVGNSAFAAKLLEVSWKKARFTGDRSSWSRLLPDASWRMADLGYDASFQAAGACAFVTCMAGWYLIFAILLASLDFPLDLPVGDLSRVIRGKSEMSRA